MSVSDSKFYMALVGTEQKPVGFIGAAPDADCVCLVPLYRVRNNGASEFGLFLRIVKILSFLLITRRSQKGRGWFRRIFPQATTSTRRQRRSELLSSPLAIP